MSFPSDKDGFPEYHDDWESKPKPVRQTSRGTPWYIGCLAAIGAMALLGCFCGIGLSFWLAAAMEDPTVHIERTLEVARKEPRIQQELGQPIVLTPFNHGFQLKKKDGQPFVEVTYEIQGPDGEGTVHFRAVKRGNRWTYPEAYAEIPSVEGRIPLDVEPFVEEE